MFLYATAHSVAAVARKLAKMATGEALQPYRPAQKDNIVYLVNMQTAKCKRVEIQVDHAPPTTYFARVELG